MEKSIALQDGVNIEMYPVDYLISSDNFVMIMQSVVRSFVKTLKEQVQIQQLNQDTSNNYLRVNINNKVTKKLQEIQAKIASNIMEANKLQVFNSIWSMEDQLVNELDELQMKQKNVGRVMIKNYMENILIRMQEMACWLEAYKNSLSHQDISDLDDKVHEVFLILNEVCQELGKLVQKQRISIPFIVKILRKSNMEKLNYNKQFVMGWKQLKKNLLGFCTMAQPTKIIKLMIKFFINKQKHLQKYQIGDLKFKKFLNLYNEQIKSQPIMARIQKPNNRLSIILANQINIRDFIKKNFKTLGNGQIDQIFEQVLFWQNIMMTNFIRKVINLARMSNQRLISEKQGDQFRYYSQNSTNICKLFLRNDALIQNIIRYKQKHSCNRQIQWQKLTYPSKLQQYFQLRTRQQKQQQKLYRMYKHSQDNCTGSRKLNATLYKYVFGQVPRRCNRIVQEELLPAREKLNISTPMVRELILQHYQWMFVAEVAFYRV